MGFDLGFFYTFEEVLGFDSARDCLSFDGAIVPSLGFTLLMITISLA